MPSQGKPKAKAKPKADPKRTKAIIDSMKRTAPCFDRLDSKEREVYLVWSLDAAYAYKTKDMTSFVLLATTKKPHAVVDKAKCRTP